MPLALLLDARLLTARLFSAGWIAIASPEAGPELPPPPPRPAEYSLTWDAPPQCPSAASILARVEALSREPEGGEGTAFVRAQVTANDRGYRLELATEFLGSTETRVLDAQECGALADATALVIVATMQPALVQSPRVPDEPASPEPVPPPQDDVLLEPAAAPAPARVRRRGAVRGLLRAALLGEWGFLPGPSGGATLAIGAVWPRIRAELEGLWVAPRSTRQLDGRSARVQLAGASARACYRIAVRRVELPACAGLEVAAAIATPRGTRAGDRIVGPSLGPKLGLGIARHFGRVGVIAAVEAVGRGYGTELRVDGTRLFQQFPVSGRLWLGLELLLPARTP